MFRERLISDQIRDSCVNGTSSGKEDADQSLLFFFSTGDVVSALSILFIVWSQPRMPRQELNKKTMKRIPN